MIDTEDEGFSSTECENSNSDCVKELFWNKFLPYNISDEADLNFVKIKNNLIKAIAMRDMIGAEIYCRRLTSFIKLYGLKFSKDDHIRLIKIVVKVICLPDLEPVRVNCFCIALGQLLRKKHVSPDDLEIDWKPFYDLFFIYLHKTSNKGSFYSIFPSMQINLSSVIQLCSAYFSPQSTKEILDLVLPKLQPLDVGGQCQTFEIFNLFLNFHRGYELWFDDFMNLWNVYHNPPWNEDMMMIMGNLAFENIGKIDWNEHLPVMFTRILRSLNLPVAYKKVKVNRNQNLSPASVAKWIVSTLGLEQDGQKHLTLFIKAIESYLHPANSGKWIKTLGNLLVTIPEKFIRRLEIERYRKIYWKDDIPESHKLTENCITSFVESLKSAAFQAMYSKIDPNSVYKIFKHLANLRPNLIIPEVIKRVYSNLDLLTEPHRLTASYQCLLGVCKSLISGQNGYTDARTDVIPILFAALPGIDTNDLRKAFATMNFYGAFLFQIPIVDCSKTANYNEELTESEAIICEQTSEFENFVLQYIDRLFVMIKFTTRENIRMEHGNNIEKSRNDLIIENSIASGLQAILGQCSDEILLSAARKVTDFVQFNILESSSAAPLLGNLVYCVGLSAGHHVFKMLVSFLGECLNSYFEEHPNADTYEKHPNEFLYYYTIFYYLFKSDTRQVLIHLDTFLSVLDKVIEFKCLQTAKITSNMIACTLTNLSRIQTFNVKSYDEKCNSIPIRYWGAKMNPNDTIEFFVPGKEQRDACEKIIHRYLPGILSKFKNFYEENSALCREDIVNNCSYVLSFFNICNFIPMWDEPLLSLYDTVVDETNIHIKTIPKEYSIYMPDGSNIRLHVLNSIEKLLEKILKDSSDDIQSLKAIIMILHRIHRKGYRGSFEAELKTFRDLRDFQEEKLSKFKRDIKFVVANRVLTQQTGRIEMDSPDFSQTHKKIMLLLLKLSTSHYSAVRQLAQSKLAFMFSIYPLSFCHISDEIIEYLKLDPNEHHEAFKGILHTLTANSHIRLKVLVQRDWLVVEKFWLNILKSIPSEKPSIIRLIEYTKRNINEEFVTITVSQDIPDSFINFILKLYPDVPGVDVEQGLQLLNKRNKINTDRYYNILNEITNILENNSLHWRYHYLGSSMIFSLAHPRVNYPPKVAMYFIQNLINESIKERKLSIRLLNAILSQQKRKHIKIDFDPVSQQLNTKINLVDKKFSFGLRDDNMWLQYDVNNLPDSEEKWNNTKFVYKNNGYFGWSSDFKVYAQYKEQPSLDRNFEEMNEIEQALYNFLKKDENIEKFVTFMALEENKEKEKFKRSRFLLIKSIFRMFGDTFYESFHQNIVKLIKENKQPSNHRCAAEIICGVIRGMKHWPFGKTEHIYKTYIVPLIDLIFEHITVETDNFWGTCFATSCENMDPRQQYWLYEALIKEPLREKASFLDCSRIFILQGPFNQHVWRMSSYSHRLLECLKPYLKHPFQNVRNRLGSLLINIFESDIQFPNGNPPICPLVKDMIDSILKDLKLLNDSTFQPNESDEFKAEICLYKTVCTWITGNISRNINSNKLSYFDLLPVACRYESYENDIELAEVSTVFLGMISQAITQPEIIESALNKMNEVSLSNSWNARLAVIDALQVLVFHNLMIALNNDKVIQKIEHIVLTLLEDNHISVREKAAEVLGGLLHCSFLTNVDELIKRFSKKCRFKATKPENNSSRVNGLQENSSLKVRHSGVLGLCAFISAFPYTIPDFIPNIFDLLSKNINDAQPIPSTIRKVISDFKRTHCNDSDWASNKEKFSEDQLCFLSDLTVPPSYYV
ncbi:proteasome activator complex subunit 4-like [Condylostylus longicornis]|uniref:proteasome activator complex subunit 4-like n=1 Tax=Condylostylus longicornis TaxID=2530218 RepID=UPI00244E4D99|nr:proteasome activator complex subunit 4-like [Condylostylus longicornis]